MKHQTRLVLGAVRHFILIVIRNTSRTHEIWPSWRFVDAVLAVAMTAEPLYGVPQYELTQHAEKFRRYLDAGKYVCVIAFAVPCWAGHEWTATNSGRLLHNIHDCGLVYSIRLYDLCINLLSYFIILRRGIHSIQRRITSSFTHLSLASEQSFVDA